MALVFCGAALLGAFYVFKPVSQTIDVVRVLVLGEHAEGQLVLLLHSETSGGVQIVKGLAETTDVFGGADFRDVPAGKLKVVLNADTCPAGIRSEFEFGSKFRFDKPRGYELVLGLDRCVQVGYWSSSEYEWKWSW